MATQNRSHAVMSRRFEGRDSLDDFPTPPWATRALVEHVLRPQIAGALASKFVWEPACGRGFMARPLAEYFASVKTSDVQNYGWDGQLAVFDFLSPSPPEVTVDWIITNPPFRHAAAFAHRAMLHRPRDGIALLVRTAFLEGIDRYSKLFATRPPTIVAQFAERVPIVRGRYDPHASSATAYCWLVWRRESIGSPSRLVWIPPCRNRLQRLPADCGPDLDAAPVSSEAEPQTQKSRRRRTAPAAA